MQSLRRYGKRQNRSKIALFDRTNSILLLALDKAIYAHNTTHIDSLEASLKLLMSQFTDESVNPLKIALIKQLNYG